ncbi:MAG: DUF4124 domain-containing protein [Pseudomonadota bacterium]
MRILVLMLLLMLAAPALHAEIYKCIDTNGNTLFTSDSTEAKAKGCKAMNLAPPNTISSPKPQTKGGSAATPPNFPKVDAQTQQKRDNDRRRILEQELANEQKLLDQARKDLAEQESIRLGSERNYQRVLDRLEPFKKKVQLHEDNSANLRKELAGIR